MTGFLRADTIAAHGLEQSFTRAAAATTATDRDRTHRELVDAAVADGRIPATRRRFWLDHLAKAPNDAAILAAMAAPPVPPRGAWPDR